MPTIQTNLVIGVAGGSGSGKSTVTCEVLASVAEDGGGGDARRLLPRPEACRPEARRLTNYDHCRLAADGAACTHAAQRQPIEMLVYDFAADNRSSQTITVKLAPVIVMKACLRCLTRGFAQDDVAGFCGHALFARNARLSAAAPTA
jgi:uridine kinase